MIHTISITERDLISAQRLHATPTPMASASLLALALAAIAAAVAANRLPLSVAVGAVMSIPAWLALMFNVIIPCRARRIYRRHKSLQRPQHFRWDDQFVHFRSACFHGRVRWADFTKVKENRDMLLLYRSGTQFNIFPKRCFPGPDSLADFRSRLASPGGGQTGGAAPATAPFVCLRTEKAWRSGDD